MMKAKVSGTRTVTVGVDAKGNEEKELIGIEETREFPATVKEALETMGEKPLHDLIFDALYDREKNALLDLAEIKVQKEAGVQPAKKRSQARFVKVA